MFVARVRSMWEDFLALSKKYWFVYVSVLLVEDRAQGWVNDQIDKFAPSAIGDAVSTPFLLFIGVIAVLGLLAFLDTRRDVATLHPSGTGGQEALKSEFDRHLQNALAEQNESLRKLAEENEKHAQNESRAAEAIRQERDALAKTVTSQQQRLETQSVQISVRDDRLKAIEPKIAWADSLVERARGVHPLLIQRDRQRWLSKLENLDKNEPWFEIGIVFEYCGVHRLIIGERIEGRLARWNHEPFNLEPILTFGVDDKPPFDHFGPSGAVMRLRQRVSTATAADLRTALGLTNEAYSGTERLFNLISRDLFISVRLLSYDGEVLFDGRFLGEDLETRYTVGA